MRSSSHIHTHARICGILPRVGLNYCRALAGCPTLRSKSPLLEAGGLVGTPLLPLASAPALAEPNMPCRTSVEAGREMQCRDGDDDGAGQRSPKRARADTSQQIGALLLRGWTMRAESCPDCMVHPATH
jgi:hypothetical protein